MAITPLQHYSITSSTHEDLTDLITNISPTDTPFLSMVQKGPKPASRTHNFPTDELGAASDATPQTEGFVFASDTLGGRTILTNYVEILKEAITTSDSLEWMNQVGTKSEKAYQMMKAAKQLAIRQEYRHWSSATGVSGATGTAPEEKAILSWITSEVSSATANRTLTTTIMNTILNGIWENGGDPDYIFCTAARQQNLVNLISTNYGSRQVPGTQGKIEQYVQVFQSDFGTQTVVKERHIDANTYGVLELGRWALCYAVPPHRIEMGKEGYRSSSLLVTEYTIEARAEAANGKISQISG